MEQLNGEGQYITLHITCEAASVTGPHYVEGNQVIYDEIFAASRAFLPKEEGPPKVRGTSDANLLQILLEAWATEQTKPIVLLIDEIDSLSDLTLISVLRQLRGGYQRRPTKFPQSVALIGLKDVRDYKVMIRNELQSMGTASPFNIKDESLTLRNFTRTEVQDLYRQHTQETGQAFTQDVLEQAFHLTQGQPWLVNALAKQCVHRGQKAGTAKTIDIEDLYKAKETIIQKRETHLDSLISKLKETRVRRVVTPILEGDLVVFDDLDDDLLYLADLGLIQTKPAIRIANPIYQEVIPRALNHSLQATIPEWYKVWLDEEDKLDWPQIWDQFLEFWREVGAPLMGGSPYHEIAPHLVLMAYLQRIANAKGQIIREYAVGYKRMDLLVRWPYQVAGKRQWQEEAIELKVWKPTDRKDPIDQGLQQLSQYLNGLSLEAGTLIIFDRRDGLPDLEDRVKREFVDFEEKRIQVIRG